MASVVLDASALLAVLHRERGGENVVPHLRSANVSAVNYSEVLKKMEDGGSPVEQTEAVLAQLMLNIVPFEDIQAQRTAEIWPACKSLGLSLADRACLALGMTLALPVLSADKRMADTELDVTVTLIRERH